MGWPLLVICGKTLLVKGCDRWDSSYKINLGQLNWFSHCVTIVPYGHICFKSAYSLNFYLCEFIGALLIDLLIRYVFLRFWLISLSLYSCILTLKHDEGYKVLHIHPLWYRLLSSLKKFGISFIYMYVDVLREVTMHRAQSAIVAKWFNTEGAAVSCAVF